MRAYLLPNPAPFELKLQKRLSGTAKPRVAWDVFRSGEVFVRTPAPPKAAAVIGWVAPPHDDVFRTALLLDTLRRNGAKDLTLILPYFAYERQDRQLAAGDPVSANCMAKLMAAAGAKRILTVDLHSRHFPSPIPVKSVSVLPEMAPKVRKLLKRKNAVVVSPDQGGLARAKSFAAAFGADDVLWIKKHRAANGTVRALSMHGDLTSEAAVIVDDMLDSGHTVAEAVRLLRKAGVKEIHLCVTHALFTEGAVARIRGCKLASVTVSDTVELPDEIDRLGTPLHVHSAISALAAATLLG